MVFNDDFNVFGFERKFVGVVVSRLFINCCDEVYLNKLFFVLLILVCFKL